MLSIPPAHPPGAGQAGGGEVAGINHAEGSQGRPGPAPGLKLAPARGPAGQRGENSGAEGAVGAPLSQPMGTGTLWCRRASSCIPAWRCPSLSRPRPTLGSPISILSCPVPIPILPCSHCSPSPSCLLPILPWFYPSPFPSYFGPIPILLHPHPSLSPPYPITPSPHPTVALSHPIPIPSPSPLRGGQRGPRPVPCRPHEAARGPRGDELGDTAASRRSDVGQAAAMGTARLHPAPLSLAGRGAGGRRCPGARGHGGGCGTSPAGRRGQVLAACREQDQAARGVLLVTAAFLKYLGM